MTKIRFSSTQVILGSFLMTVLIGTVLLFLPISSNSGKPTDFLTCLFTATSSLCVTGLVVVDTATHWSLFGQIVILILIQIGGLGVVVVTTIISLFLGQKINLSQRTVIQEALAMQHVGGTIKLIKFILRFVLFYEFIGAFLLFVHFRNDFNFFTSIWYSIFHSISAFCNAGFDLMGVRGPFSSFTSYESSVLLNVTIMMLIIFGGIGFAVWEDVIKRKFNFKKYRLQSKLVIVTTFLLIMIPATYFYFFEYHTRTGVDKILPALFQSVTTRTAGFNTTSFADMSEVGKAISIILMLIGGSPGSTAGGMKTTTFAIIMISTMSVFKRHNEPHIFNRRIGIQIVKNATTIFVMYINLFLLFGFVICKIEGLSLTDTLFETASAIGTVGLTLGITTKLSTISRVLIILLMFLGRVGGLTFIYALIPSLNTRAGYISENVAVG